MLKDVQALVQPLLKVGGGLGGGHALKSLELLLDDLSASFLHLLDEADFLFGTIFRILYEAGRVEGVLDELVESLVVTTAGVVVDLAVGPVLNGAEGTLDCNRREAKRGNLRVSLYAMLSAQVVFNSAINFGDNERGRSRVGSGQVFPRRMNNTQKLSTHQSAAILLQWPHLGSTVSPRCNLK